MLYKPAFISLAVLFVGILLIVISARSYTEVDSFRLGIAINFLIGLVLFFGGLWELVKIVRAWYYFR